MLINENESRVSKDCKHDVSNKRENCYTKTPSDTKRVSLFGPPPLCKSRCTTEGYQTGRQQPRGCCSELEDDAA